MATKQPYNFFYTFYIFFSAIILPILPCWLSWFSVLQAQRVQATYLSSDRKKIWYAFYWYTVALRKTVYVHNICNFSLSLSLFLNNCLYYNIAVVHFVFLLLSPPHFHSTKYIIQPTYYLYFPTSFTLQTW